MEDYFVLLSQKIRGTMKSFISGASYVSSKTPPSKDRSHRPSLTRRLKMSCWRWSPSGSGGPKEYEPVRLQHVTTAYFGFSYLKKVVSLVRALNPTQTGMSHHSLGRCIMVSHE